MATGKMRGLCVAVATFAMVLVTAGTAGAVGPVKRDQHPSGPPAAATRHWDAAQKILLYGDSITQGTAGHYTWRYRLWKGFQAAGTPVDFVGPINTLWSFAPNDVSSTEYRDPNFDTAHAAYAGMTISHPVWTMSDLAQQYRPDVIVGLIGLNDLTWGVSPDAVIDMWRQQIIAARKADPGVVFVVGQYGQTWRKGVPELNAGLAQLAQQMDKPLARVLVAQAPAFNEWNDTMDGVHLTTSGEILQANSVAAALAQVDLPSATAPADAPENGAFAPVPTLTVSGTTVTATWPAVDYATCEDFYLRDDTAGWWGVKAYIGGTSFSFQGQSGHTYEVALAPVQGWGELGTRSLWVSVTVP